MKELEPKISVIVPAFNTEKYLRRCVDSILQQSYENIEIILVDDGSTDCSGMICDNYQKRDSRIRVIHKENGGLSDARNYGLNIASGEYVGFVDSDDWIDKDYYRTLVSIAIKSNADIVSGKYFRTKKEKRIGINRSRNQKKIGDFARAEYLKSAIKGGVTYVPCWSKLYKIDAIGKIRFKKGKLYEDLMFNWDVISDDTLCVFCDYRGYFYFINQDSITGTKFSDKMYDLYYAADYMRNNYFGNNLKIQDLLQKYYYRIDYSILVKMLRCRVDDIDKKKELFNNLNKHYIALLFSSMSLGRKLVLSAIMIMSRLSIFEVII